MSWDAQWEERITKLTVHQDHHHTRAAVAEEAFVAVRGSKVADLEDETNRHPGARR